MPEANVSRWLPTVVEVLRQAGVPERDVPPYAAATLALIHYESRGNPTVVETKRGTGAYGLTQQIARWHPQHKGNPRAHLLHFATRLRANTKPNGAAAGSVQSFFQAWASGPRALDYFVRTGKIPEKPPQFFRQVRNIQDMVAGTTWRKYAGYTASWIQAGQPTTRTNIDGRQFEVSPPNLPQSQPLASPSDGYLYWKGKKRKIGDTGPGGLTNLQLGTTKTTDRTTMIVVILAITAAGWLVWRGST